jgi:hypothetical protein
MNVQNLQIKDDLIGQAVIRLLEGSLEGFFIFMKILDLELYIMILKPVTFC